MREPIFNLKMSKKLRIAFSLVGITLIVVSVYVFYQGLQFDIDNLLKLSMFALAFMLGFVFIIVIFNYKRKIVSRIRDGLLGASVLALFLLPVFRDILIFSGINLILFIIFKYFIRVISTFITAFFSLFTFFLILYALVRFFENNQFFTENFLVWFHLTMISWIVIYRLFGIRMNKLFITNLLGQDSELFDIYVLRENFYFIYGCFFIILSTFGYFWGDGAVFAIIFNNMFLSAVIIFQIEWRAITNSKVSEK